MKGRSKFPPDVWFARKFEKKDKKGGFEETGLFLDGCAPISQKKVLKY